MKRKRKMDKVTKTVLVIALVLLTIMLISLGRDVVRSFNRHPAASGSASAVSSQVS